MYDPHELLAYLWECGRIKVPAEVIKNLCEVFLFNFLVARTA